MQLPMEATIRLERCPTRCTEMYRSVFWTRSSGALRSFTALLRLFEEEALCWGSLKRLMKLLAEEADAISSRQADQSNADYLVVSAEEPIGNTNSLSTFEVQNLKTFESKAFSGLRKSFLGGNDVCSFRMPQCLKVLADTNNANDPPLRHISSR